MNEQTGNGLLELEVSDFGPVIEARIDLRPLTVFVGPSNTGKSYLAILIYALHQVFSGDRYFRGYPTPLNRDGPKLSGAEIGTLLEAANSIASDLEAAGQRRLLLSRPVAEVVRSGFGQMSDVLSGEIARCFGVEKTQELIRRGRADASRIVMRRKVAEADPAQHTVLLGRQPEFTVTVPAHDRIPVQDDASHGMVRFWSRNVKNIARYLEEEKTNERDLARWAMDIAGSLREMTQPFLFGPLHLPAYYLPADRTGVMHAHSVVVGALIANAPAAGLRPAVRTPTLSGVLADFLAQLIEIGQTERNRKRPRGMERDIAGRIEESILSGSVRVDRSAHVNYPRFAYRPRGWKDDLALANASSMVSELAPVVLYLQHMIEPGNVLIVEEPESHLHPAMQVEFTRQLAALVDAGIRVIVTTHSEWLLEELANIVRRSELPEAAHDDKIALRPEQVGAWLFKPKRRPRGSVVSEIPLDESGLYPSGYDEVAAALHNDWADISSRIEGVS